MKILISAEFDQDLSFWKKNDQKIVSKIRQLLSAILQNPYKGIGKPEPLKYKLSGCWSRRINREHRLIYRVINDELQLLACRYHYQSS